VIEREDDDGVAVVRLAHGPVSAMDVELCRAVGEQFRALADDPARAVVVTGTGTAFSAGADLRRYLDGGPAYVTEFLPALAEMFHAVFELGKPVVAAVNGHAIAGGGVLAAACDARLMAQGRGRIGVPELRVGVPFPRVALEIVRYAVGDAAARRLVFGAMTYGPDDARTLGLVDEVVPADELRARAVGTARELSSSVPADTFAATKAQLHRDPLERVTRYSDEDAAVHGLWIRRAEDGWAAHYLESVTKR
jgi:enoyl-CoA hydratase